MIDSTLPAAAGGLSVGGIVAWLASVPEGVEIENPELLDHTPRALQAPERSDLK